MMEFPNRKPNRLRGYDYSTANYYFVTICTKNKSHILWDKLHDRSHTLVGADAPTQSLSQLVKSFKILVTKELGYSIFQRSFHDHIIRSESDYLRIWQYIDTNPYTWKQDCFYTEE